MKVKKYVGATMQDTIFKVKADLGPDAIILNTRKYKKGLFGLFGKSQVEVLAALEEKTEEDKKEQARALEEIDTLKRMIKELNEKWEKDGYISQLPEKLALMYEHLELQGVKKRYNQEIFQEIPQDEELLIQGGHQLIKERLVSYLGPAHPIELEEGGKRVVAFVGPTGVGKTTTVAKLAARYALDEKRKVGLITSDTYRIAAVQQLKTYSDIINIPLEVIYSEEELKDVVTNKFTDYNLILLDTAGSSWNDQLQLERLQKLVCQDTVDEIHLMVSLNTKSSDIFGIIDRFKTFDPDKIILTKLDETTTYGDIINIKKEYNLPFSYYTFGQDVPDDIEVAEPVYLISYLLGDYYA